jgi:hypothetical protein
VRTRPSQLRLKSDWIVVLRGPFAGEVYEKQYQRSQGSLLGIRRLWSLMLLTFIHILCSIAFFTIHAKQWRSYHSVVNLCRNAKSDYQYCWAYSQFYSRFCQSLEWIGPFLKTRPLIDLFWTEQICLIQDHELACIVWLAYQEPQPCHITNPQLRNSHFSFGVFDWKQKGQVLLAMAIPFL